MELVKKKSISVAFVSDIIPISKWHCCFPFSLLTLSIEECDSSVIKVSDFTNRISAASTLGIFL